VLLLPADEHYIPTLLAVHQKDNEASWPLAIPTPCACPHIRQPPSAGHRCQLPCLRMVPACNLAADHLR
jgi:hypothetical protein